MPFTVGQFFEVFEVYNAAIWPAQIAAYVLGLTVVAALWSRHADPSRLILLILALAWFWNGVGYHALFFAAINPAAKVFAALFVLQAILLAACAFVSSRIEFHIERDFRTIGGLACIAYTMLIYPALGHWAGHGFMAGPMFGVAPCPTTIFTIGLLLLARGPWVLLLAIVPFLWSLVGLAAALQLDMTEDLALPAAGVTLVAALTIETLRTRRSAYPVAPLPEKTGR